MRLYNNKNNFISRLLLLLLISFFLIENVISKNVCGGNRPISGNIGSVCDPGIYSSCRTGILVCKGLNSVVCVPNCNEDLESLSSTSSKDLDCSRNSDSPLCTKQTNNNNNNKFMETSESCGHDDDKIRENQQSLIEQYKKSEYYKLEHEKLLKERNLFCSNVDCGRNGVCDEDSRECKCFQGYSGQLCESFNICETIESEQLCNNNGVCVSTSNQGDYECNCFDEFSGKHCETDLSCQPGGVMINNECICSIGYTGELCQTCEKDSICVPTNITLDPFTLIHAPNDIRKEMLSNNPPPGYDYGPIKPGTMFKGIYYNCQCRAINTIRGDISGLKEGYINVDDHYYQPQQQYYGSSYYLHDYYGYYRNYGPYGYYYYGGAGILLFFLFTIFFIFLVIWLPCNDTDNHPSHSHLPTSSTSVSSNHQSINIGHPNSNNINNNLHQYHQNQIQNQFRNSQNNNNNNNNNNSGDDGIRFLLNTPNNSSINISRRRNFTNVK